MMKEQADETWLSEFKSKIKTDWDFTAIHVNKNNLDGVKKDIASSFDSPSIPVANTKKNLQDHYSSYGKPIWVTEFACVNGMYYQFLSDLIFRSLTSTPDVNGFVPCTNQDEINSYINTVIP